MRGSADFSRNNLDCLRLLLASIVVLFHVDALTNLSAFSAFGKYCSPNFAVRSFFVISGLLIYRSYMRSSSIGSYMEKRARRIYPAYLIVIVLAALALYLLSNQPPSRYFGYGFWKYLGANLLFLNFLAPSLPGVFTSNGLSAVDGALWTLKIEVAFYLFVPIMHYLCNRFGTKRTVGMIFCLSTIWKYGFAWLASIHHPSGMYAIDASRSIYSKLEVQFPSQLVYFSAGVLLLLYFDKLKSHFLGIACITACLFLVDHFFTGENLEMVRTRVDRGSLRRRLDGNLAVMRTARQEPALDQIPQDYRCQANQQEAEHQKQSRVEGCQPKRYQGLQYWPMNDIGPIREISVFRKMSEIAPESEDEDQPRYPEDVEDFSREKMVNKKQTCSDAGNAEEMGLQFVKIQQIGYPFDSGSHNL